jgi:para-nitrobenzyl esterase
LGAAVVKEAGLKPTELQKLQSHALEDFYAIATKTQQAMAKEAGPGGGMTRGFSPIVDGKILPQHPYDPEAAPTAADVPMIISSVQNESRPVGTIPRWNRSHWNRLWKNSRKEQVSAQA